MKIALHKNRKVDLEKKEDSIQDELSSKKGSKAGGGTTILSLSSVRVSRKE